MASRRTRNPKPKRVKGGERGRFGYAYVPSDLVASVLKLGYLSMRGQYDLDPIATATILEKKYGRQYDAALSDGRWGDSLLAFNERHGNNSSRDRQIMGYLDWRDEATERGSYAIYFFYAPIPKRLEAEFNRVRDNFLKDRTLMHLRLPDGPIQVVDDVDGRPAEWYATQDTAYWTATIDRALKEGGDDALWLAGVPHGYIVPDSGRVEAFL